MADEDGNDSIAQDGAKTMGLTKVLGLAFGLFVLMITSQLTTAIMAKNFFPRLVFPDRLLALEPVAEEMEVEPEPVGPPIYAPVSPSIVVSFQNGSSVRFLQVSVEAMARDDESIDAFVANLPRIRNNLLLLFASQNLEDLATREGKEAVRAAALAEVQGVLAEVAKGAHIEDLYFTNFVVQ